MSVWGMYASLSLSLSVCCIMKKHNNPLTDVHRCFVHTTVGCILVVYSMILWGTYHLYKPLSRLGQVDLDFLSRDLAVVA